MADFPTQGRDREVQASQAPARIAEPAAGIEIPRSRTKIGDVSLDMEKATLDDVTAAFSQDVAELRSKTGVDSLLSSSSSATGTPLAARRP